MLRSVDNLIGFSLGASDGEIGRVHSFLFDCGDWTIRYLVVDTGRWLPGRKVLIPSKMLDRADWQDRLFRVDLTKEQVRDSPQIDTEVPVSRQREVELHKHYGWVPYWGGSPNAKHRVWEPGPLHGLAVAPEHPSQAPMDQGTAILLEAPEEGPPNATDRVWEPESSLRSTRQVKGYHLHATDGQIGHVEDFIISDEDWVIRYLVVDTRSWLLGQSVLISPEWVKDIGWEEREVRVDVPKKTIEESPPYDPSAPVNREYEVRMYDYYGRPKYWA
jgi:hypothetical protein